MGDAMINDPTIDGRFFAKVRMTDGCWIWTGAKGPLGYGTIWAERRRQAAHRVAYKAIVGPIPAGYHIDHLCRNPSCVRPEHLEAVPPRINCLRGIGPAARQARQTHCKRGHRFTPENTYYQPSKHGHRRTCRTCEAARAAHRWGQPLPPWWFGSVPHSEEADMPLGP